MRGDTLPGRTGPMTFVLALTAVVALYAAWKMVVPGNADADPDRVHATREWSAGTLLVALICLAIGVPVEIDRRAEDRREKARTELALG